VFAHHSDEWRDYAKDQDDKASDQIKRIDSAASVLEEIMGAPDKGIPQEVFESQSV